MSKEFQPPGWPIQAYCVRIGCGHPAGWHKLDDALNLDPTAEGTPYRCIGFDTLAPGTTPPDWDGNPVCDCADMLRSQANLDALETQINQALRAVRAAGALRSAR
jgi:hypothetical protein